MYENQRAEASEIDFSDIAEMTMSTGPTAAFSLAKSSKLSPCKEEDHIYVDADGAGTFQIKSKGYQTTINRVLRQSMLREAEPHYGTHKPGLQRQALMHLTPR